MTTDRTAPEDVEKAADVTQQRVKQGVGQAQQAAGAPIDNPTNEDSAPKPED
jgi:hypothetical protein